MSIGLLFWVLMVLWFFSWVTNTYSLFFVLLFLLGWHAFGFVIHA
jgi:hypothetical protein